MTKSRWFVFTNFNLEFDWVNHYNTYENYRYICYGTEVCPTTGREHQQGWIYLKNPRANLKELRPIHSEVMMGSIDQNDVYCSKQGSLTEFGTKPRQGERKDLDGMMRLVEGGATELELAQTNASLWCQYGRRFEDFRRLLQRRRRWETKVIVFYGPPGSGKTRQAHADGGEDLAVVTFVSGQFFQGYNGESKVLLDDFDHLSMPRQVFLHITDRYPYVANVKNGSVNWAPEVIYITSNYHPREWYGDDEAVLRRISVVEQK